MTGIQAPIALRWDLDDRKFRVWQEEVCEQLLAADPGPVRPERIDARLQLNVLPQGTVTLDARLRFSGLGVARTAERIARETREVVGLSLVLQGSARVRGAAGERVIEAGDVGLFQSSEPFEKTMSADYREFFLYLPLDHLKSIGAPSLAAAAPGVAPRRGLGRVLGGAIAGAAGCSADLGPGEWPPVLRSIAELAAGAFLSDETSREQARPAARAVLRSRVLRFIDGRLAAPDLSPGTIAAALGMSVRYLHLLFQGTGETVAATILARRLDRCRAALADPAALHRSVSEIGFAWGFNDAAHFSRTFKARFGLSPRAARATLPTRS